MTCAHCEATSRAIQASARPRMSPSESYPIVDGRLPKSPTDEIWACGCECHTSWKMTWRHEQQSP